MIDRPRTIGIIPIKEHSSRAPLKNFRLLGGAPLWMYSLAALVMSGEVDEVVIDTDAPERFCNVEEDIPIRIEPRYGKARGDDVSMNVVLDSIIGRHPADRYIQTHATSPFITFETIRKAVAVCQDPHDSLYTVTERFSRFWQSDGRPVNHFPEELKQTQDLPPLYEENSALYIFSQESFKERGNRIGARPVQCAISELEGIDIDTEADWRFAELLMAGKQALAKKPLTELHIV